MREYVRVREPVTGAESTVSREFADMTPELVVLDKPAVDDAGRPLRSKLRVAYAGAGAHHDSATADVVPTAPAEQAWAPGASDNEGE